MNSAVCLLERSFGLYPNSTAVSDAAVSYTYTELRERARRAASALIGELSSRAPVMVYLPKSADMVAGFCAAMYSGRPYVPTDAAAPRGRLEKIIANLAPSAIITNADLARNLEGIPGGHKVFTLDALAAHEADGAAISSCLLYTSPSPRDRG